VNSGANTMTAIATAVSTIAMTAASCQLLS
jgi:hypothetical protein